MKLPRTHTDNIRTLHIPDFTKGLSPKEATHEDNSGYLEDCLNVWAQRGVLKTRPALNSDTARIINDSRFSTGYYYTRSTTDIEILVQDQPKRMLLEQIDLDLSHFVCLTHLIKQ